MCRCLNNRAGFFLLITVVAQLSACSWRAPTPRPSTTKPIEGGVAFSNVVLAQADAKGKLLWKFQAQGVTYGENQQLARAKTLKGQLFEAGRPLFDITAENGTVRQEDQQVRLQGNIRVVDRRHNISFRGKEAQWKGSSGQLLIQNGFTALSPALQLWGSQLQASQQGREVRVTGNVIAETQATQGSSRRIRLRTNQALWTVDTQRLKAGAAGANNQPSVTIEQLNTAEKSTALAGTALADLKSGMITLSSPVQVQVGAVRLTSRSLNWDTQSQKIVTNELLQIQDPRHQISVLANRGTLEQSKNVVDLQGNVEVKGLRNSAQLNSDQLLWDINTQRIEAVGSVNYVQGNPSLTLRGPKAVGKMTDQTLRVSGGDVVTEIIP